MTNEMLFFLEAIFVFGTLLLVKRFLKEKGLIAWVAICTILANIQVCESIKLFGLDATLGNVLFASTFLATDILAECYSKKAATTAVLCGVASMIFFIIITQLTLAFTPSEFDMANGAMQSLFTISLRTTAASLFMYAIANLSDVYLFTKLSDLTNGKHLWLRNNIATIVCNCLENFGFVFLAFAGIMENDVILNIALTTCVIESILALFDTPFAYIAKRIKS